jgi:hypothetical protein
MKAVCLVAICMTLPAVAEAQHSEIVRHRPYALPLHVKYSDPSVSLRPSDLPSEAAVLASIAHLASAEDYPCWSRAIRVLVASKSAAAVRILGDFVQVRATTDHRLIDDKISTAVRGIGLIAVHGENDEAKRTAQDTLVSSLLKSTWNQCA